MKPIFELLTEIANRHLNIPTLRERRSDRLDFHDVSVWDVKDALFAAYQAGQRAQSVPSAKAAACLDALMKIRLALAHHRHWASTMPGHLLAVADRAIAEAESAGSLPAETAAVLLPILAVTVRGGLIEDMDATQPIHVVVEDWDITDDDTGKKPARNVWTLAASLSAPRAERLCRLIAHD